MDAQTQTILDLLKGTLSPAEAAQQLGLSEHELSDRRRQYLESKLPKIDGNTKVKGLDGRVEILRDAWGVAHIEAKCLADGFFGLGYAMAQDRLWQLDHMRRLAGGRLAEILGAACLDQDRLHRTIGLRRSADAAVEAATDEVTLVLTSLTAGINAWRETCPELPLEFDLLDYAPEPWTPSDSVAVWKWRWWMLTGRLNILAVAEAGKRHLVGEQFRRFMTCEASEETIVPGDGPAATGGHDTGEGSNNWVVGGSRTGSGKPILATDPHNSVDLSRQWYQAQLTCPGIDAIGAFFLGTPGIYLGHTRHTAWGVTNHTASARDVYVEREGAGPDSYVDASGERPFEQIVERIGVRDGEDEEIVVRLTERGPLVQDFIPAIDDERRLLSLKWNGAGPESGFESMLSLLRSASADDVIDALRDWPFPILNFVFADDAGRIGYHAAGFVPQRGRAVRGFRDPSDPRDTWTGNIPFDEMPELVDPDRDWVATANNPPWGGDHPYLRLGSWSDGYRFRRIRQRIESVDRHDIGSVGAIHADVVLGRAEDLAPRIVDIVRSGTNERAREVAEHLAGWDGAYDVDSVAASVFSAFWYAWLGRVARARFPDRLVDLVRDRCAGVAREILEGKQEGWLAPGVCVEDEVIAAMQEAGDWLHEKVGTQESWQWGKLHTVTFGHPCATTPELTALLTVGPTETSGVTGSVRAAGHSTAEPFKVTGLSTYRMVVDMADPAHGKATAAGGQSGHPASPHYRTQSELWLQDDYHPLLMDRADIERHIDGILVLE